MAQNMSLLLLHFLHPLDQDFYLICYYVFLRKKIEKIIQVSPIP